MASLLRRARDRLELRRGALHERRLQDDHLRGIGRSELDRWFVERHGPAVLHGPFAGLRYPERARAHVHHLTAKLLGAYEEELADLVAAQVARRPPLFVDVGAADGYYAVGFARASAATEVHAYEIDPVARRTLRALARANGARVRRHGPANARRLAAHALDGAFVLADCEGAELDVLDGPAVPALARATLLVELHPHGGGDTGGPLRERFEPSHAAREIAARRRDPGAYRELDGAPAELRDHAVDEVRPTPTSWLLLEPRG
ncbi:MAG TPA: hypothetical protein VF712_07625 [Thermoleophilaceae bacterium]|jgi:hypothetical protein